MTKFDCDIAWGPSKYIPNSKQLDLATVPTVYGLRSPCLHDESATFGFDFSTASYCGHRQQSLLRSPSTKKTGIIVRMTASEFRGPTYDQTGPAAGLTALKNSTEIPDSLRTTPYAPKQTLWTAAVYNYATFWAYTGMRTSEINGLEWDDVDFSSSHVAVTHVNVTGERKETTKTSQARNLLMNSRALAALNAQKEHTWLRGGPVFRHPVEGTPWNDELAFRRSYWTRSLKRLGMRYRRPYQMRHTYACQLLMAGVQVGYCAQIMGHSTETFLRTYSKWINSDRDKAEMARLEAAMAADVARAQHPAEAA